MTNRAFDAATLARLDAYLSGLGLGFGAIRAARPAGSGQSNPTYILRDGQGREIVLRQRPFGKLLASAHAVDREYRVMRALAGGPVPVPTMLAYCEDRAVIGVDFYLMTRVAGQAYLDPRLPTLDQAQRATVGLAMARVLAQIHATDLAAAGLADFGAPGAYFARGLARWTKQYRASETQTHCQLEELMDWLARHQPAQEGPPTLLHGDYRLDNLLIDPASARIQAVVDWELSTTGHPLSDLGAVLMQWSLPPGELGRGLLGVNRAEQGLIGDEAFIDAYVSARDGDVDLGDLRFATAFAFFRMASILQGVVKRGLDGNAADPAAAAQMASYIPLFAAGGLRACRA